MEEAEFDKFADEYTQLHRDNIRLSGEGPAFFAEYKVRDVTERLRSGGRALRILDFGAGVGTSVPYFKKHIPSAEITCLDVSSRSLDIGRSKYRDYANFDQFDGRELPYSDSRFDVIFAACVFHHIEQAEHLQLLRQMRRVLVPGGQLFVFEHNPYNPLVRRAVQTCPYDENAVLIASRHFVREVRKAGYAEVRRFYRIFFPGVLRILRPAERFMSWLPLGAQYYVWASKPHTE